MSDYPKHWTYEQCVEAQAWVDEMLNGAGGPEPAGLLNMKPWGESPITTALKHVDLGRDPLALVIRVGDRDVETRYRVAAQPLHWVVTRHWSR